MGTPEFPHLGKHCSVDECRLIDFLPFTCDRCDKVFCLQHRSYTHHQCPNANRNDVTVVICPLCAKGVRLVPYQDPNITWESHVNTDCDPSNYQHATRKRRCPAPRCKEVLNLSNSIKCKDCTQEHCLKHRFGPDHNCAGPRKPDSGLPFIGLLNKSQRGKPVQSSGSTSSSWWGANLINAVSNFRGSSSGNLTEQCVQCGARFSTASALVAHVEKSHHRNSQPGVRKATIDACPKCSKGFRDPVALVEHIERDHGGTSRSLK